MHYASVCDLANCVENECLHGVMPSLCLCMQDAGQPDAASKFAGLDGGIIMS